MCSFIIVLFYKCHVKTRQEQTVAWSSGETHRYKEDGRRSLEGILWSAVQVDEKAARRERLPAGLGRNAHCWQSNSKSYTGTDIKCCCGRSNVIFDRWSNADGFGVCAVVVWSGLVAGCIHTSVLWEAARRARLLDRVADHNTHVWWWNSRPNFTVHTWANTVHIPAFTVVKV